MKGDFEMIPAPTMSEILQEEFLIPMNLTAKDIPIKDFQAVLNDELPIDTAMSKKLADFFGVSDMFFFNMQKDIDARTSLEVNSVTQRELSFA